MDRCDRIIQDLAAEDLGAARPAALAALCR